MAALRFLSALLFLIALVALAADATPLVTGQTGFYAASVQERWAELAPAVLAGAQQSFTDNGLSGLWQGLVAPVLSLPAFILFGGLAILLGYAGRRKRRINVFIN